MALPPEHIHIKRRRDEEPVDSLCEFRITIGHDSGWLTLSRYSHREPAKEAAFHRVRISKSTR